MQIRDDDDRRYRCDDHSEQERQSPTRGRTGPGALRRRRSEEPKHGHHILTPFKGNAVIMIAALCNRYYKAAQSFEPAGRRAIVGDITDCR
jgi:hypothetical protein